MRKLLLMLCLAAGALAVGEVYHRLKTDTPEAALKALGAPPVMTRTLLVNGRMVTARVWQLPPLTSADPIRKTKGPKLIVDNMVYTFEKEGFPVRGECAYPNDLPAFNLACDYVMEGGSFRFVSGQSLAPAETLQTDLDAAAQLAGWESVFPSVWRKGQETLFARISESRERTHVALIVQKETK